MALQSDQGIERVAVKAIYAADILRNIIDSAKSLEASERKISLYVNQANVLLALRHGNAALRMVGSTAKTVGVIAMLASSFNPKYRIAVNVSQKLWKIGTGLKILTSIANIIKEMWQKGCRNCLLEFTRQTALMVKNLGVFNEVLGDLRNTVDDMKVSHRLDTPEQIWTILSNFVPAPQRVYFRHVICIVTGSHNYSPLFDFASLITDPSNNSNVLNLMREFESLQFLDFVHESDLNTLVAIGSFLHVTRELMDFLDGLSKLTGRDCLFLKQCLTIFSEESLKIKTVVLFLKNLHDMKSELDHVNVRDTN